MNNKRVPQQNEDVNGRQPMDIHNYTLSFPTDDKLTNSQERVRKIQQNMKYSSHG